MSTPPPVQQQSIPPPVTQISQPAAPHLPVSLPPRGVGPANIDVAVRQGALAEHELRRLSPEQIVQYLMQQDPKLSMVEAFQTYNQMLLKQKMDGAIIAALQSLDNNINSRPHQAMIKCAKLSGLPEEKFLATAFYEKWPLGVAVTRKQLALGTTGILAATLPLTLFHLASGVASFGVIPVVTGLFGAGMLGFKASGDKKALLQEYEKANQRILDELSTRPGCYGIKVRHHSNEGAASNKNSKIRANTKHLIENYTKSVGFVGTGAKPKLFEIPFREGRTNYSVLTADVNLATDLLKRLAYRYA